MIPNIEGLIKKGVGPERLERFYDISFEKLLMVDHKQNKMNFVLNVFVAFASISRYQTTCCDYCIPFIQRSF